MFRTHSAGMIAVRWSGGPWKASLQWRRRLEALIKIDHLIKISSRNSRRKNFAVSSLRRESREAQTNRDIVTANAQNKRNLIFLLLGSPRFGQKCGLIALFAAVSPPMPAGHQSTWFFGDFSCVMKWKLKTHCNYLAIIAARPLREGNKTKTAHNK